MKKTTNTSLDRRRALALLGGGAAAISFLGLAGCGGSDDAPQPELIKPEPEPEPASPPTQKEPVESTAGDSASSMGDAEAPASSDPSASDGTGTMPRVDEGSAKARQLAYVHDAATVSTSEQPRYAEGQQCANCALYQGGSAEWGGCPLFSGQQVKRTGWCNAYAPRGG
ncbi:high-potential iron-sulfur protein [Pseudohaliea rubra]|uniref:High-potential iron-sulfur protein n=1 Tax=Pseudohaliea rubra DSM 19751 TaxID=1265313 RepID=A0A095XYU0_9GAMM|nr:high-potential iron-sulfur protein [Pseudohaliea rubra]KGE04931.1 hypothetical protein HRUBRA_00404 [Pseudohaliea rubra DSM 19751]